MPTDRARVAAPGRSPDFLAGIQHVMDLMREAGLVYSESHPDTIYPYSNGYSTWFISKEQSMEGLSTAPLSAAEIAARIGASYA